MSIIVGAGLAGLIAAHAWPTRQIVEAATAPVDVHKALLRFRTDAVSRLIGIEFRRVNVRKSIFSRGRHVAPDIALANMYSRKVTGRLAGDRSIWNMEQAVRFVAPDDLWAMLLDACYNRITWGQSAFAGGAPRGAITTAPMSVALSACGIDPPQGVAFDRSPVRVRRFRIPGADVFQTVYFPDPDAALYRASITGDLLIIESSPEFLSGDDDEEMDTVRRAFSLPAGMEPLGEASQRFGKIVPLQDADRRRLLFAMTHEHELYSLGRFATWRNILLDDVVNDIDVIKRLMRGGSYSLKMGQAGKT